MAGNHTLTGQNALNAAKMLRLVTTILEQANIKYSLDAGTLLGIARENRLLPWDTDMDLAIPRSEFPKLRKVLNKIRLLGYKARIKPHIKDDPPLSIKTPRIVKIRDRKYIIRRGKLVLDIFIKTKIGEEYIWAEGKDRYVVKTIPAIYLDELSTIEFQGKQYSVPADIDGYLTCRYGDWKTPVKVWDHIVDDKAATTT